MAEITGGDALGRGHQPALSWWLPEGSSVQRAYQVRTDDGVDTGRVDAAAQSFVRVPVFDRSRRFAEARVRVWTDRGESEWSDAVALESGLLGEDDWTARWIGVAEEPPMAVDRPGPHVLAVLLADGWYRGQVGLPRAADQYGTDVALRAQVEVEDGTAWRVVAATDAAPGRRPAGAAGAAAAGPGGRGRLGG